MNLLRKDCNSYCPKQFFKRVVTYLGIEAQQAPKLAKELQQLLR
jgi:hypothetical protein